MTTGFFQFFNSKGRSNSSRKSRRGRERNSFKPRRLVTEALEERQLLAVDPALGAALATEATVNVINITSSNSSIEAIKQAVQQAAATSEDDLIRVPAGTLDFTSAADTIEIDYDPVAFGTITIQAVGGDLNLNANSFARVFTIFKGWAWIYKIS